MSHSQSRTTTTKTQKRQRFLQHLWSAITGGSSRSRVGIQRLRHLETLEERRLLTYTASLVVSTANFVGDGAADVLTFDQAGGLLRHNRFTAGDAGFNSDFDFDSATAGDQTLAANVASTVLIDTGDGADTVNVGTLGIPASTLFASFNYSAGGATDILNVDDSASLVTNNYVATSIAITGNGINLSIGTVVTGGRNLVTSSAADTVSVQSVFTGEAQSFDSAGGIDTVTVGSAGSGTSSINASVNIKNTPSFTNIIIENAVDAVGRTVTVTNASVTGLSTGSINYVAADVNSLTVKTGSQADTVNVNSVPALTNLETGAGDDAIAFADGIGLNGGTIDGGADTDTINYSAYTTGVAVNLGLNVSGLAATLSGDQEVPANTSTPSGTATITNYNTVTRTFDISVTVNDLAPASVTGFHIHRGAFGVNGPVIVDFSAGPLGGILTPRALSITCTWCNCHFA